MTSHPNVCSISVSLKTNCCGHTWWSKLLSPSIPFIISILCLCICFFSQMFHNKKVLSIFYFNDNNAENKTQLHIQKKHRASTRTTYTSALQINRKDKTKTYSTTLISHFYILVLQFSHMRVIVCTKKNDNDDSVDDAKHLIHADKHTIRLLVPILH